jgi:hypothetical protein
LPPVAALLPELLPVTIVVSPPLVPPPIAPTSKLPDTAAITAIRIKNLKISLFVIIFMNLLFVMTPLLVILH